VLTNPVVVLAYWLAWAYLRAASPFILIALELAAVLVEGLCYRRLARGLARPFGFSLGANLFSFGCGWAAQRLLGMLMAR
jgi:hypothetical protein